MSTVILVDRPYLNEQEAAQFCGLSHTQFKTKVMPTVTVRDFFGKKVYDKKELLSLLENAPLWHRSTVSENHGTSTGPNKVAGIVDRLESSVRQTQRRR